MPPLSEAAGILRGNLDSMVQILQYGDLRNFHYKNLFIN